MTSRSSKRKRRSSIASRKKGRSSGRILRPVGILLLILGIVAVVLFLWPEKPVYKKTTPFRAKPSPPVRETVKEETKEEAKSLPVQRLPRVAIVIDDMGYDPEMDRAFMRLDAPLSLAFLPFGPHTKTTAGFAHEHGKEVLLHLPMESVTPGAKLGQGALFADMSDHAIARQVSEDIDAVPHAKGVNNHMGSRFTACEGKMRVVLREIKKRRLFYVDSRTTAMTKGLETARALGVKSAERSVFLDNVQDVSAIRAQMARLVAMAGERGSAIGIGHPHDTTYEAIRRELPALRGKVEVVPVSSLVE